MTPPPAIGPPIESPEETSAPLSRITDSDTLISVGIAEGKTVRHVGNERTGRVLALTKSGRVAIEWADGTVAIVHPVWLVTDGE